MTLWRCLLAIRVHTLAKELSVKSKAILDKCQAEGLDIKNHMSILSAGLEATIREWFSEGDHATTQETADRVDLEKVKEKPRRRKKKPESPEDESAEAGEEPEADVFEESDAVTVEASAAEEAPAAEVEAAPTEAAEAEAPADPEAAVEVEAEAAPAEEAPAAEAEPIEASAEAVEAEAPAEAAPVAEAEPEKPREPVKPVGQAHVPAPAVLQGPRVVRMDKPEVVRRPGPARQGPPRPPSSSGGPVETSLPSTGRGPRRPGRAGEAPAEDEAAKKKAKSRFHPRRGRVGDAVEQIREWRDKDLLERSQRLAAAADHPQMVRKTETRKVGGRQREAKPTKIQVTDPMILKDFCAATGLPFNRLFPKLMELGLPATINQAITGEQAEMLALAFELEVEVVRQKSRYEELVYQFEQRERTNVKPRPPIVTFLGHVDHGKTSLLDRLRHARVAQGEAGGITQHIGAYRYEHDGRAVVFLDTPGHEAFTALRARGAHMTDIVVLVVAADDGVMPQTVEAISHAKAAEVPIVVALNKVDLPNADFNRIYGQLAEHQLAPSEWGGETDVIKTSAVTGEGMDSLIEHLYTLSELLDLKADPDGPAAGVVIEARQDLTRGPVADVMIREGTLKVGDVIAAGRGFGRVRAIFNDLGKSIQSAGPATPVEILGLDEVPDAGEHFYGVADLQTAKGIAEEKRQEDQQNTWMTRPKVTLENIFQQVEAGQVKQLNIIVRADAQGSVDVLRTKLEELSTDEVHVRILHVGTGGITEGDVLLAEASEAIVIGFGVVADDAARGKAHELDVQIKTYTVIYHLIEEISQAIEGLLEPTYQQTVKGRATIKEVFKVSRVGTIAGCLVNDGQIERSAKIRVIRQNVIVREDASLESLKRFKDDVREVRQGLECGMKIAGFDDLKEGDVIEAYEMVEVARKLQSAGSS